MRRISVTVFEGHPAVVQQQTRRGWREESEREKGVVLGV